MDILSRLWGTVVRLAASFHREEYKLSQANQIIREKRAMILYTHSDIYNRAEEQSVRITMRK